MSRMLTNGVRVVHVYGGKCSGFVDVTGGLISISG